MGRKQHRCVVEGCENLAMLKHYGQSGAPMYRAKCQRHHRMGWKTPVGEGVCSLCGWKGSVHRHRQQAGVDGGRYDTTNVVLLCPNDHAHAHGRGDPNRPPA